MEVFQVKEIEMSSHSFTGELIKRDFELYVSFKSKKLGPGWAKIIIGRRNTAVMIHTDFGFCGGIHPILRAFLRLLFSARERKR